MIIFHEGMPRSGKSYAAVKDHLVSALAKGRKCYVRIDGLNKKQLAELAGRTLEEVEQLLVDLTEDQCKRLEDVQFDQDAFLMIDEAQNYWPSGRKPLTDGMTKFIAEHGHHGLDILLMGQLAKDVHRTWLNRVNRKMQFIKKDVVGKDGEYKWIMQHGAPDGNGNVKFREVSRGDAKYETRYFGTYKSHSDGTENKDNYKDDRSNVFKSAAFRKWLPLYGVVLFVAIGFVVYVFKGGGLVKEEPKSQKSAEVKTVPKTQKPSTDAKQEPTTVKTSAPAPADEQNKKMIGTTPEFVPANQVQPAYQPDYIEQLTSRYRVRLGGYLQGKGRAVGIIEWRDEAGGLIESLSLSDISGWGWLLLVSPDGRVGTMQKGDRRYIVTAWPLQDERGTVKEVKQEEIRNGAEPNVALLHGRQVASAAPVTAPSGNDSTNPKYNPSMRSK